MEERPEEGAAGGAADEGDEPLATAFERLSSVMAGEHDWADEAEDDEGVPSSELFADILPDEPDNRDEAELKVAELPADARLTVVLRNCPTIFGPHEVTRLFSGIPVADIQVLRPAEGGKVCCVDFLDRRDLAEALRRSPEDIGKPGVEVLLAAEDESFERLLQELQPPPPPPPPPAGIHGSPHGHGGHFPPGRAPYPPPDHGPLPGSSGHSHPMGGGYGGAAGPPRDNHHHHGPPMGPGRGFHQGPPPDNRGPMHEGPPPRSSFEGRRMDRPPQRRSFEEGPQRQGGRGNAWRPYDGPQQQRGPPGGFGHGPPPPPHGHPLPPGGPGGRGSGGPGGYHGPPPPRWMDGGPGGGPGGGMGPHGGAPDHRLGPRGPPMQQHGPPPPGYSHGPPHQHHPHPSEPPAAAAAASERPRLKLAPRTKPVGEEGGASSSAAGPSGKPNPFGNAKPIDTAAKLEEIERKHHMAEAEVQHPHSHKPSEPPAPDLLHSALVDPPSASGEPRKILPPPPRGATVPPPPPPPGLHRPPGL